MGKPDKLIQAIKQNKGHLSRFVYLASSSLLQIGSLNFVVYPYLSRRISDHSFGEFLLLMTTINFAITALGGPLNMAFYRRYGDIPDDGRPLFTGMIIKMAAVGLSIFCLVGVAGYDLIARYWDLSIGRSGYFYLTCYSFFYILDAFLLARMQVDYNFKAGFYSRIVFFLFCLLIIPAYIYFPRQWMISFILAPAAGGAMLLYLIGRKSGVKFQGKISGANMPGFARDYLSFFLTCFIAQMLLYGDRWLIASFGISKAEIAYFTIAVQAGSLVIYPVERFGELIMPSIANLKSLSDMSRGQARKLLLATCLSVGYVITVGSAVGYSFFLLYKPAYLEHGWRYFLILLAGMCLYPVYIFSRGYFIRFCPSYYLLALLTAALAAQVIITVPFLAATKNAAYAAAGKSAAIAVMAAMSIFFCQWRIYKIAFSKSG